MHRVDSPRNLYSFIRETKGDDKLFYNLHANCGEANFGKSHRWGSYITVGMAVLPFDQSVKSRYDRKPGSN